MHLAQNQRKVVVRVGYVLHERPDSAGDTDEQTVVSDESCSFQDPNLDLHPLPVFVGDAATACKAQLQHGLNEIQLVELLGCPWEQGDCPPICILGLFVMLFQHTDRDAKSLQLVRHEEANRPATDDDNIILGNFDLFLESHDGIK